MLIAYKVADDLSGKQAERDAIAAIAEREIAMGEFTHRANVGQSIVGLGECAGPGIGWFDFQIWKELAEFFHEFLGFGNDEGIALFGIDDVFIFAAQNCAIVLRGAEIKIWADAFPNQAALWPAVEIGQRLSRHR